MELKSKLRLKRLQEELDKRKIEEPKDDLPRLAKKDMKPETKGEAQVRHGIYGLREDIKYALEKYNKDPSKQRLKQLNSLRELYKKRTGR